MPLVTETYVPEQLFASDYPVESQAGVAGGVLVALTPVKQNAVSFKWEAATVGATGLITSDAVLDAVCTVYVSGTFNIDAVNWNVALDTTAKKQYSLLSPLFVKQLV